MDQFREAKTGVEVARGLGGGRELPSNRRTASTLSHTVPVVSDTACLLEVCTRVALL